MPRVSFTEENKVQKDNYNYPKLKLEKDEKARIAIIEDPVVEYRHTLRKPVVVNGRVEKKLVEPRSGEPFEDYKLDFVSSALCTGSEDALAEKGIDPDGCHMCKAALEDSEHFQPPQVRYAMHVIRYKTRPGSTKLAEPFSVDLVVWSFNARVFNTIIEKNSDWEDSGGLKAHDLFLTCTNGTFQNYDFDVAPDAAWSKTDETKKIVKQTHENNQIPDLSIACGSRKQEMWIKQDVSDVKSAWDLVARIEGGGDAEEAPSESLSTGLSGLMDSAPEDEPDTAAEPEAEKTKAEAKEDKPAKSESTSGFADIFDV